MPHHVISVSEAWPVEGDVDIEAKALPLSHLLAPPTGVIQIQLASASLFWEMSMSNASGAIRKDANKAKSDLAGVACPWEKLSALVVEPVSVEADVEDVTAALREQLDAVSVVDL